MGAKRLVGAKRPGGKRPVGKCLGGETTRGGNGLGAKRPGFGTRPRPWLNSNPEGEISLSYMDSLMMDCFSPTFHKFFLSKLKQSK